MIGYKAKDIVNIYMFLNHDMTKKLQQWVTTAPPSCAASPLKWTYDILLPLMGKHQFNEYDLINNSRSVSLALHS
jgi:hypothetical protein